MRVQTIVLMLNRLYNSNLSAALTSGSRDLRERGLCPKTLCVSGTGGCDTIYGRGGGVGRGLGVNAGLGVGEGLAVAVGVADGGG